MAAFVLLRGVAALIELDETVEDKLAEEGLRLVPHTLETKDGYELTLFHVVSREGAGSELSKVALLHHDTSMDGASWFETKFESLPSKLMQEGFDVWLSNDRGTRYSQRHVFLDAKHEGHKYFDFSWAEIGLFDIPANLAYVAKHAPEAKITYVAYGQGGTALLYAMASDATKLSLSLRLLNVVILAPCIPTREPATRDGTSLKEGMYDSYAMVMDLYDQIGVYAYNGPNRAVDANKLCEVFGKTNPECRRAKSPSGFGQTISVKAQKHSQQNYVEGRFQEYSDTYLADGGPAKRVTAKVDLSRAQEAAQIFFVSGSEDVQCPTKFAHDLLGEFGEPQPSLQELAHYKHATFVTGSELGSLAATIKKATLEARQQATGSPLPTEDL